MNYKNHKHGYGLIAITVHWLMALTVVALFALGLWMTDLTYYDTWYKTAPHLHKSIGILLALIFLFRIVWRLANQAPDKIPTIPVWELRLAHLVHLALYLLIFSVIVSGYMISTADGRAIDVFNWFSVPAWITPVENQEDIAGKFHFYLACALIALAGLHAGAALKHHFYDKDATLRRMINPNYNKTQKESL